jgi:hypothetical protein
MIKTNFDTAFESDNTPACPIPDIETACQRAVIRAHMLIKGIMIGAEYYADTNDNHILNTCGKGLTSMGFSEQETKLIIDQFVVEAKAIKEAEEAKTNGTI